MGKGNQQCTNWQSFGTKHVKKQIKEKQKTKKREKSNWQRSKQDKETLNIKMDKENANQGHDGRSFPIHLVGNDLKIWKYQGLKGMGAFQVSCLWRVQVYIGASILESRGALSLKQNSHMHDIPTHNSTAHGNTWHMNKSRHVQKSSWLPYSPCQRLDISTKECTRKLPPVEPFIAPKWTSYSCTQKYQRMLAIQYGVKSSKYQKFT